MDSKSDETETRCARVVPAGDAPFSDVEAVFGTRGDPAGCWCQWYKIRGAEWSEASRDELRDRLAAQLAEPGPGPGLLAYDGDTPVGWCAVEPRPALVRLQYSPVGVGDARSRLRRRVRVVGVVLRRAARLPASRRRASSSRRRPSSTRARTGRGSSRRTPSTPTRATKPPAAELFPGTVSMFAAAGFVEVARPKPHRVVMQHPLHD